ncbi:hypothetical protein N0002_07170 [Pseudomonas aeruginosa]|nr:hypothetical protein [Pseudomonas aeruginosa]ETU88103.1 hypothetical protein Q053_02263 [Pseudomonas aeruginosa BWHPSA048]ERU80256.1 hypothetical protein Q086_02406 [Pseudomonas aeruginosa C23]ERU82160.1 hypothetical protein Q085_02403 [Pseudomonas aeruginosa C20]ERW04750.1 hypothetical protein Q037_02124 [Pseudomonas aeruginosa BWHPSA024]ERW11321.1 hypothetical protein Q036_05883 [Pseudomonas aeruginosa BWHPSA023]
MPVRLHFASACCWPVDSADTTFYGGYYGDPRNVMLTTQYRF